MPLRHSRRRAIYRLALADIADLVLTVDLRGDGTKTLLVARDQDAVPPPRAELSRDGRPDARVAAGNDRYRHTRTTRVASRRFPPTRTTARSVWRPRFARRGRHVAGYRPAIGRRTTRSRRLPS